MESTFQFNFRSPSPPRFPSHTAEGGRAWRRKGWTQARIQERSKKDTELHRQTFSIVSVWVCRSSSAEKKQQGGWREGWKCASNEKREKIVPSYSSPSVYCGLPGGLLWGQVEDNPTASTGWREGVNRWGLCMRRKEYNTLLPRTKWQPLL